MSLANWLPLLDTVPGLVVRVEEPMGRHTSLRVGGKADVWLVVESRVALETTAVLAKQHGIKLHFFQDSQVLVRDGGLEGVWVRIGAQAAGVSWQDGQVSVGSQYPVAALAGVLQQHNHAPVPYLEGRSGTVEKAYRDGLLSGWVELCTVLRGTKVAELPPDKCSDKQPLIRLLLRNERQPVEEPEGQLRLLPDRIRALGLPGRIMQDPDKEDAGLLMLEAGLSGVRLRGVRIGTVERNTLINLGGASESDIWLLIQMIRDRVKAKSGHQLTPSIKRFGRGIG